MYTLERVFKENPSFSSTLLDKIYRSIDESDSESQKDLKFYRGEPMQRKQSKGCGGARSRGTTAAAGGNLRFERVSLVEKWMERKAIEERKELLTAIETKSRRDQDALFFSSTSSSSESSSGSFSPSETDSTHGAMSLRSCFVPSRPKQVRNCAPAKSGKPLKTGRTLFNEFHHCSSVSEKAPKFDENLIKSKSRAMKIYNNLKKVKQPLSPGGRLASFINSLVSASSTRKSKNFSSMVEHPTDRKVKSEQVAACSTASSFSRSCLSKNSPATRERLRNGVKRTVKFYPVSVIVDEECRPCGQKSLGEKEEKVAAKLMAVSVPSSWKIGKFPTEKTAAKRDLTVQMLEKSKRVEEMAREFLKEYHQNKKISEDYEDEEDNEDDAASYCSSDLFELDHLKVIGTDEFRRELPVYETTHVDKNRAIAHGLIV